MIYNCHNTMPRAVVYDGDARLDIERVMSIDTESCEVVCAAFPIRPDGDGGVEVESLHFSAIYPIRGGDPLPSLFLCYGKVQ